MPPQTANRKAYRKWYYAHEPQSVKDARKNYAKSVDGKLAKYRGFIKQRYGLTFEAKEKMFAAQNGLCAIGGEVLKSVRLAHIDHNHATGKVRALLCVGCNTRLAVVENKDFCLKASLYLRRWD